MTVYYSELMTVQNVDTEKLSYYIRICGYWRKCSKSDYSKRLSESYRRDCFKTTCDDKFIRQYVTVYVNGPAK